VTVVLRLALGSFWIIINAIVFIASRTISISFHNFDPPRTRETKTRPVLNASDSVSTRFKISHKSLATIIATPLLFRPSRKVGLHFRRDSSSINSTLLSSSIDNLLDLLGHHCPCYLHNYPYSGGEERRYMLNKAI
jgi:hypothetical protein